MPHLPISNLFGYRQVSGIHNDLKNNFDDYLEVYKDVKTILGQFAASKGKSAKRKS